MLSGGLTIEAVVALTVALYGGAGLFLWFARLERRDRPELVIAVLLGVVIVQTIIYRVDADVPLGPFRPGPLRLPELLIITALAARAWVRGFGTRLTATGAAWLVLALWYAVCLVNGLWVGNSATTALFHAKFVIYAGGGYVLASGIPVSRFVSERAIGRWLLALAAIAAVQVLEFVGDVHGIVAGIPDRIGPDGSSLYFGLALVAVLVEAARRRRRLWVLGAAAPLAIAPLFTTQRATLVHVVASVGALGVLTLGSTWRRRIAIRPTQLALGAMTVVVVASVVMLPRFSDGEPVPPVVQDTLDETFGGIGNQQSSSARVLKWEDARSRFGEHPLFGSGMGVDFVSFRPGKFGVGVFERSEVYDSVPMDVAVRTGAIGLVLMLTALALSMRDSWRVWRHHHDDLVATLALGVLLFLVGFMAKGVVESVSDKLVLSTALGIGIGMVGRARSELGAHTDGGFTALELEPA